MLTLRTFESFTEESLHAAAVWGADRGLPLVTHVGDADPTAPPELLRGVADDFLEQTDRLDGVFCLYERLAVELLAVARERRIDVPRDLRVVTISEMGLAASTSPPMTTLNLEQGRLGETAASLLADLLEGGTPASVLDVPTKLTLRGSTAERSISR